MNIVGVIAEYNPFHYGHLYHLEEAKKIAGAQGVICAISGNFTQRGEPALVDKWARAEMALEHGADLILELPVLYACRSAYWFARGGVELLYRTGITTHLAFGVEADEPENLSRAAGILARESPKFKISLRSALKSGISYPRARAQALEEELGSQDGGILSKPNNILGIAYLQALEEMNLPLIPVMVKRQGSAYNDPALSPGVMPSATAIRTHLLRNKRLAPAASFSQLESFLPPASLKVLKREFAAGHGPIDIAHLTSQIITLLRRSSSEELRMIVDISEGLENRISRAARKSTGLEEFLALLKTKRFTYTRLQRFLIHLLLNYTKAKDASLEKGPPYLRILGFNETGRLLLQKIKKATDLPVITKGAHGLKLALQCPHFCLYWEMDLLASDLYSLLYPRPEERRGGWDYLRGPVRLRLPDDRTVSEQ